jgi:hypothetical protein
VGLTCLFLNFMSSGLVGIAVGVLVGIGRAWCLPSAEMGDKKDERNEWSRAINRIFAEHRCY